MASYTPGRDAVRPSRDPADAASAIHRRLLPLATALAAAVPLLAAAGETAGSPVWTSRAPMPVARTEVAAATVNGRIAVVGGMTRAGQASRDAWLYAPGTDRWRALPRF